MEMRFRLNHSRTQKDGWRFSEDTVEIVFDTENVTEEQAREALVNSKRLVYDVGTQIARERNAAEAGE